MKKIYMFILIYLSTFLYSNDNTNNNNLYDDLNTLNSFISHKLDFDILYYYKYSGSLKYTILNKTPKNGNYIIQGSIINNNVIQDTFDKEYQKIQNEHKLRINKNKPNNNETNNSNPVSSDNSGVNS